MKKLNVTKGILWGLTVLGGFLVGQGLITGVELAEVQNVVGMALGGGSITIIGVLGILQAIPKTLITEGYKKAVDVYGQPKVDGFINKIDDIFATINSLKDTVSRLESKIDAQDEVRANLLNKKV